MKTLTIALDDATYESLRGLTKDRNAVSAFICHSPATEAEMASFILRDHIPEKAEFWAEQIKLRGEIAGRKVAA